MSQKLKVLSKNEDIYGSHLVGYITTNYNSLFELLGKPTHSELSGDEKVQKEWVVKFGNEVFTIYDWKNYDEDCTLLGDFRWHIGGTTSPTEFISYLESRLK